MTYLSEPVNKMKKIISDIAFPAAVIILFVGYSYGEAYLNKKKDAENAVRRDAICPSLLSISRSARDTLLVMKAEPLCNSFVLDNIK